MKKIIALCILFTLILAIPTGCKKTEPRPADPDPLTESPLEQQPVLIEKGILLFFPDRDGNFLLHEFRKITVKSDIELEDMAKLVLKELIKGTDDEMRKPIIDQKTDILSLKIHGTVTTVDLSGEFIAEGYSDIEKLLQVYSVVNTLSELGLSDVFLLVEGEPITEVYTALGHELPFVRNDDLTPGK